MSTMIRVPVEIKEKVEALQSRFYARSMQETIVSLIEKLHEFDKYKEEQAAKWEQEKRRQNDEDVILGAEIKENLTKLQSYIGLQSPGQAIEFLIDVFDSTPDIGKIAFLNYVQMKK